MKLPSLAAMLTGLLIVTGLAAEASTEGNFLPAVAEAGLDSQARNTPDAGSRLRRRIDFARRINGHIVRSHTVSLLKRPLSAAASALALAVHSSTGLLTDTFLDAVMRPYLAGQRIPPVSGRSGMARDAWEAQLDSITGTRSSRGSATLLVDGEAFFTRLTEEISRADDSIRIRTYIFDNDDYALEIADRLKRRSDAVQVEVAMDGIGTLTGGLVTADSAPAGFAAPTSIAAYLQRQSRIEARTLANTWLLGDHTKTYIFDQRTAFLGGMNIGREYRYDWHDMMVELKGPVVAELVRESDRAAARDRLGDLSFFTRPGKKHRMFRAESEPGANLRLLRTLPHDSQIYRAQLAAARNASSRIYIENAYFSDDRMLYALIRARLRGVDVRVIIPSRGDSGPMDRSNAVTVNTLTRFGVRVFIYPGMSHVKAALFDGWACFGSANFDGLSLRLNRELNIGTSDPQIVADLEEKIFEVDFARSTELREPRPVHPADHIYEWLADLVL